MTRSAPPKNLKRGDVVVIRSNESGFCRTARISEITRGNRVSAWWIGSTNARGDFITKPTTIDPARETIVRKASREQREVFLGMVKRIEAQHRAKAIGSSTNRELC